MRKTILDWVLVFGLGCGVAVGQAPTPVGQADAPAHHARKKAHRRATVDSSTTPVVATPVVVGAGADAQQRAADQRLLQQQQAASADAQRITDQQVKAAQKQHDQLQNESRIQDAPGASQTGVVPAAGSPVAPASGDQRIQDAPGPAQTLPPLPAPPPGSTRPQF